MEAPSFVSGLAEASVGSTLACGSAPEVDVGDGIGLLLASTPLCSVSVFSCTVCTGNTSFPREREKDMNHDRLGDCDTEAELEPLADDVRFKLEAAGTSRGGKEQGGPGGKTGISGGSSGCARGGAIMITSGASEAASGRIEATQT